ncbi:cardiolipin synthase [Candidatus Sumerlaeota bacterium]|nr:cardiolipin synthase [Candidatus Sumerlaeota bacterium]
MFEYVSTFISFHVAAIATGLLVYFATTHFGRQRRQPAAAVAWVLGLITFPYIALPLFLFVGTRKLPRLSPTSSSFAPPSSAEALSPRWASQLSASSSLPSAHGNSRFEMLADGEEALNALLALIDQSARTVDFCTYLFADDEVGRRVAAALAAAQKRGVRVRLLLDMVGSLRMSRDLRAFLAESRIEFRWFVPFVHNPLRGRMNLRNHRKLVVVDGARIWSGGRNIAAEYFISSAKGAPWRDISFVIEGAIAEDAQKIFDRNWPTNSRQAMDHERISSTSKICSQLIPSGPDFPDDTIYNFLITAIHQAQESIIAVTPYFVPNDALLEALIIACKRGVAVTLIIPRKSNHRLADIARERSLRELSAAQANVMLLPRMNHAKVVVIDDSVACCGSANLDGRSLFLNYELITAFYGAEEIVQFRQWSDNLIADAVPYRLRAPGWFQDLLEGFVRAVSFQL